jgi:hypothetical protein
MDLLLYSTFSATESKDTPTPLRNSLLGIKRLSVLLRASKLYYFFLPFVLSTTSTQFLCMPRFSSAFKMASFCGP